MATVDRQMDDGYQAICIAHLSLSAQANLKETDLFHFYMVIHHIWLNLIKYI